MSSRALFCRAISAATTLPLLYKPRAVVASTKAPILVTIFLVGGNDGLNTVIPLTQYGKYADLRKPASKSVGGSLDLAIPLAALGMTAFDQNFATNAAKATTYAFHPNMMALRGLYAQGKVAVINGVGIPPVDTNRLSHVTGQFDWQSGTVNKTGVVTTGWLGKTLDSSAGGQLPAMLSLTGEMPLMMQGNKNAALVVNAPLEGFTLYYCSCTSAESQALATQFSRLDALASGTPSGEFARGESASASDLISVVQGIASRDEDADYPTQETYLGQQLQQIARVICSGAGVSAYYALQGGYDTHLEQQTYHPALLQDLSDSIAAFYTYLSKKGASHNVAIVTLSDFGRHASGNSTFGTDHGTSSVSFAIGDMIKGGVYGQYPNLSNLDLNGDLMVEVDFRNELSDLISFLGGDSLSILGQTYPKLGFIS